MRGSSSTGCGEQGPHLGGEEKEFPAYADYLRVAERANRHVLRNFSEGGKDTDKASGP